MKEPRGYIIYEGASLLDGKPIVMVALTGKSRNTKTGAMMQTYIIRADIDPRAANKSGADYSICGDCPHRGEVTEDPKRTTAANRSCYVNLSQGVLQVYKQYKAGAYPHMAGHLNLRKLGADRVIRIGTYGDGASVPEYIISSLVKDAKAHTAYSHQSRHNGSSFDDKLYMVSADSKKEAWEAWKKGRRTFRVMNNVDDLVKGQEILCPASKEAGQRVTCLQCKLCGGASVKAKSIAIVAHGAGKSNFKEEDRI